MTLKYVWTGLLILVAAFAEGETTDQGVYPYIANADCIFVGSLEINDKNGDYRDSTLNVIYSLKGHLKNGEHIKLDIQRLASFQTGVLGIILLTQEKAGSFAFATGQGSFLPILLPPNYDWTKEASPQTTILSLLNYTLKNGSHDQVANFLAMAESINIPIPDYVRDLTHSANDEIRAGAFYTLSLRSQLTSADPVIDTILNLKNSPRSEGILYAALSHAPTPKNIKAIFPLAAHATDEHEMYLLTQALRKWSLPQTVPILLKNLDSKDVHTQYDAMMALDQIFQPKDESMGVDLDLFKASSATIVEKWKKYVAEHSHPVNPSPPALPPYF